MPADMVTLIGTLPRVKPDDAERLAVYLVRGDEILAQAGVRADGQFRMSLAREAARAPSAYGLEAVIGPAGLGRHLDPVPKLQRVPIEPEQIDKATAELQIPLEGIELSDEILQ